jgi:putative Ig domain-containing protein
MTIVRARIPAGLAAAVTLCLLAPGAAIAHRPNLLPAAAQGHSWRHGAVPQRGTPAASAPASTSNLAYGGGISGVGVVTGAPRVYLIFWGSQWGTQSTNAAGNFTYSGDPKGMAPDIQAFFEGLGTGSETWSGVMTQYCQGISSGGQSCPSSNTQHVGYPTGGALGGVWEDNSTSAPSQASAHQIGTEAVAAANHFAATIGTTSAFSPNAQYFIVSPTGTHPDGFNTLFGQFCAWHDYTGDATMDGGGAVTSANGPVAFTNMPYVTDAGSGCGQNFVNSGSAGTLDGVTIVGGHEYAETITDTYPPGGWTDSSGAENGDKCAWISSGSGASQNITLSTGSFAVQSTWANDFSGTSGGCEVSHPIVTDAGSVAVNNPGNQTTTAGQSASLQLTATEPDGSSCSCTYTQTGLPAGLTMTSGGLVSGTPTKAASSTVTVTATDATGVSGSTSFTWTILAGPAVSVSVSPKTATIGLGDKKLFKATGTDQYGNAANMSATSWTTTGPGTMSPASGASSTFTASSTTTGSGPVTATLNGVSASATVTVVTVTNPIVNGDFETGSLSPWATSGTTAETVVSTGCHTGSYCAQLGSAAATNGSSNIAQTFTAPTGSTTLSVYYKVVCPDTVKYDWATVTLLDVTTGVTATVLPKTCSNSGLWAQVTRGVTPGHEYTLTLTSHDDNLASDPTYTLYDDVSVH